MSKRITYEDIEIMKDFILTKTSIQPKIAIVCGTGLGEISNMIQEPVVIKFHEIPKLTRTTVSSHVGQFVIGKLNSGKAVICQQGRYHFYEGHDQSLIVAPIRLMKLLGVETVILTNAAGGLNQSYTLGDVMVIKDHLYFPGLTGNSPLVGPNDERFGDRFPSLYEMYNTELRLKMLKCAEQLNFSFVKCGIYASVAGPHFETNFEMRFLLRNGCDAVGMSTAGEAICAVHCGMNVVALSTISDKYNDSEDYVNVADGDDITRVVVSRVADVKKLLEKFLSEI